MNGDHGSSNGMGGEKEFVEERVAFIAHSDRVDRFIPRISVSKTVDRIGRAKVEKTFRPFQTDDITRVLDYDQATDPPPDGTMMHGEESKEGMAFPNRHFCLRGGFLFYFDLSDVNGTSQSHYYTYSGPPIGVIPLDKSVIEFPPGGRRVFREHAQSNARNGYELVILHQSQDEATRPPAFVVAETLGLREKWASALRARTSIDQPTVLRAAAYNADASLYTRDSGNLIGNVIVKVAKKGKIREILCSYFSRNISYFFSQRNTPRVDQRTMWTCLLVLVVPLFFQLIVVCCCCC
jgi:hypothetical protein